MNETIRYPMVRFYLLVIVILVSVGSSLAQSFWTGLNGPYGGTINDIVSPSAGVMLASTDNGVYRSTDSGATWTRLALGTDNIFKDLEVDPSSSGTKIYAATSFFPGNTTRVYISADAGVTWSAFATNAALSFPVLKLKVTPNGFIHVADITGRFLKSTAAGAATFNVVPSSGFSINDLDADASNNVYLSTSAGVRVYDGTTLGAAPVTGTLQSANVWSSVIVGTSIFSLDATGPHKAPIATMVYASFKGTLADPSFNGAIESDGSNVFITNNISFKVFTSASAAAAWNAGVSYPFALNGTSPFFQTSTTWFLGAGISGIYTTTNSGVAWSQSSTGIKSISGANKVFITPTNNYLFMATPGGLGYYSSTNNGTSWTLNASTAANTNRTINDFIQVSGGIIGYGTGGTIFTANEGGSWTVKSATSIAEAAASGSTLYSYSGSTTLLKSIDLGVTWPPTTITGLPAIPTKIQVDGPGNVYFIASNAIYTVPSGGTVATKLAGLTATTVQDLQVLTSSNAMFVLGDGNTLYTSTDGGTTFSASNGPPGTSKNLWVYDSKNMAICTTTNGFYLSNDGGGIWTSQPLLDSQGSVTDIAVSSSTYLYAATSNSVMHKSTNVVLTPAAPTLLTIVGKSFDEIQIVFKDNATNESDYTIEKSVGNNQNYSGHNIGYSLTGGLNDRYNVTEPNLNKNTLYFYRIKAINAAGSSAYSNEVSVTTLDVCTPTIPNNRSWTANVAADPGSTGSGTQLSNVTVNIVAVANAPNNYSISNYDLGIHPEFPANGSQGKATFVESCGQTYFYEQIYSTDNFAQGNGTWNGTTLTLKWENATFNGIKFQATTTLTLNPTDPIPAAPTMSAYLYSPTEVLLNWSSVPFATSYDIKRGTTPGGPYSTTVANVAFPLVTYIDKTVIKGQQYYYVIVAKNSTGLSANSAQAGIATQNVLFRPVENDIQLNFENQQGVAWGDLDGDGDEDIASPSFLNNANQPVPPVFYENMGNGKDFTRRDLTVLANENKDVSRDINIFDYDNDGKLDMYIGRSGKNIPDLLLINNGGWSFTKIQIQEAAKVQNAFKNTAGIDYDNDGKVDIFATNSGTLSSGFTYQTNNQLFKNTGGTSYTEIVSGALVTELGNPRHFAPADYDNDGDQDIFMTDVTIPAGTAKPNRLYRNNGDGTYTRVTGSVFDGDLFTGARTISWGDIDNDGDLDLYVGSTVRTQLDRLYQNNGNGTFTRLTGSPVEETATATFGSMMGDIDNDGDLDIIAINAVTAGNDGANSIFINQGTGTFLKYTAAPEMLTHPDIFEIGGAMADFDKDGFLDVYPSKGQTTTAGGADLPNLLYKNTLSASASRNWIEIKLVGVQSNRSAIGARITVTTAAPARTQIREISTLTGGGSANSLIAHVGLGSSSSIISITVKWPSGLVQTLANVTQINRIITITEDNTPPAIVTLNPAHNSIGVPLNTKLEITFGEVPVPVAGRKIKLFNGATLVEQFDAPVGVIVGNKISFTPAAPLLTTVNYSVSIDLGAFQDIYGNATTPFAATNWAFRSLDNIAPTIAFQAIPFKDKGFVLPIALPVTVADNSGPVASFTLSYRSISTKPFTDIVLSNVTGAQSFSVPAIDEMGINYYFTAKDADNNVTRLPAAAGKYLTTRIHYPLTNAASVALVKGSGAATDYQIVSTPWDISNKDIASNFEELSGGNTKFRFLRYQQSPPGWDEYPGTLTTFARGEGYFINVTEVSSILFTDAFSPKDNRDSLFTMSLKKGWNQIGNPYTTPIQWADVLTYNGISTGLSQKLLIFSGGYQTAADPGIIQPNKGAFVLADNDISGIKIPFQNQTSGGRINYELAQDIGEKAWEAGLLLRQQDKEFRVASVGMSPNASIGKDMFDLAVPPRLSHDFIEMSVAHPEHFMKAFARDIVRTQDEFVWEFNVDASQKGMASLTWDNTTFGNSSKELYLFDERLQKPVNMRETASYSFDPLRSDNFKVYYGENLEKKIVPSLVVLGDAYPNPAAANTTITFTLPSQSATYQVSLDVYNMVGQRVTTLVNGSFPPGFYAKEWETGSHPNGLYTYRLVVIGSNSQQAYSSKVVVNN